MAFSATFSDDSLEMVEEYMRSPEHILLHRDDVSLLGVRQFYVLIDGKLPGLSVTADMPFVTC